MTSYSSSIVLALNTAGEFLEWFVIAAIFFGVVIWINLLLPIERDHDWLPRLVLLGFAAKLVGTLARYFMTVDFYGTGDAFGYHGRGVAFAGIWRNLSVPVSNSGGKGSAFTEVVTGFVYAIYTPAMRSGFLMFAFIAFLGQLLFYAAFRPWLQDKALRRYAIAILFFPSLVFWPASVGKDALMIFFMGLATLGISRLVRRFELFALLLAGVGLYLSAQIRPHITAMITLAALLGFLLMKRGAGPAIGARRFVPLLAAGVGLIFAWGVFTTVFDVSIEGDVDTQDPAAFLSRVQEQTGKGGSEVADGVVNTPLDIPAATLKVLFRPLIYEGISPAIIVSAVEGTALLLLIIWKLPMIWRNRRMVRPNPMLFLSFFYTGGFVIAFSSILNLGILARQRVQVLPYFLVLIVALGWPRESDVSSTSARQPRDEVRKGWLESNEAAASALDSGGSIRTPGNRLERGGG